LPPKNGVDVEGDRTSKDWGKVFRNWIFWCLVI